MILHTYNGIISYWDKLKFEQYHLLEITRYTEAGKYDW